MFVEHIIKLSAEELNSRELESNPINGWLKRSDSNKNFRSLTLNLGNVFKKKRRKVRQSNHSVFEMVRSICLCLYSVGIDCTDRMNEFFWQKKYFFQCLHYCVMSALIFFTVTNAIAIPLSHENTLPLIIEFIRIFTVIYRFFCLKLQKRQIKRFIKIIQNSFELFPNVEIRENYYLKFVVLVCLYASAQGLSLTISSLFNHEGNLGNLRRTLFETSILSNCLFIVTWIPRM